MTIRLLAQGYAFAILAAHTTGNSEQALQAQIAANEMLDEIEVKAKHLGRLVDAVETATDAIKALPEKPADAPPAADKPKRGRPPGAAKTETPAPEKPVDAPTAETAPTSTDFDAPPADPVKTLGEHVADAKAKAKTYTTQEVRAAARKAAERVGSSEPVHKILAANGKGGIDGLDATNYGAVVTALEALVKV